MPERDRAAGEIGAAGKAMQHRGEGALPAFLFENARGIVVGLARMDDERQAGLARRRDMRAKAALLRLARRVVVVVIEAGFAERHDFRVPRQRDEIGRRHVELFMGVMRMRADRAKHVGKALGDREQVRLALDPRRNRHHALDAGGAGARHHGIELGGEIGKIEMAMAVDEHVLVFGLLRRRLSGST